MKNSKSHHDIHTGILDMNGVPILKDSMIRIHDKDFSKTEKIGKVQWKNGSYVCKGTSCEYNVYSWRKSIEVLDPVHPSKFPTFDELEDLSYKFERGEFGILTPSEHRSIFRKAFKLGYESKIEQEHFTEHN